MCAALDVEPEDLSSYHPGMTMMVMMMISEVLVITNQKFKKQGTLRIAYGGAAGRHNEAVSMLFYVLYMKCRKLMHRLL